MWECFYCGGTNSRDWWRYNWCNAPKREPRFVGTPGYDFEYEYLDDGPYFFKSGTIPFSYHQSHWGALMSENVSRWMAEPEGAYLEIVPATNYESPKRKRLGVIGWIKDRTNE